jgi:hypothetical protein
MTANTFRMTIASGGAITFNNAYTFPTSDGSSNQILRTDGSGALSFATFSVGIDQIDASDILTSSESFSDSDDFLMTAAAIKDRIESFGYGTGTMSSWTLAGDSGSQTITNGNTVDIAGGTGITTAASATDTVTVNLSAGTNDLSDVTINSGTLANGQILEYSSGESAFINATNQAITMSGSTDNGVLTRNSSTEATVESELTYNSGELKVNRSGSVTNKVTVTGGSTAVLDLNSTGDSFVEKDTGNSLYIANNAQDKDIYFRVNDGGSNVNAIQIDASEVGRVKLPNDLQYLEFGAAGS